MDKNKKDLESEVIGLQIETITEPKDYLLKPDSPKKYKIKEKLEDKKTTQYDTWCRYTD